jgi:hypothetical protein
MQNTIVQVEERLPLLQTLPLSLQHLFAMFGATVLVPFLFHVNPATALLFNGIGTLLYVMICKRKNAGGNESGLQQVAKFDSDCRAPGGRPERCEDQHRRNRSSGNVVGSRHSRDPEPNHCRDTQEWLGE